MDKLETYRELLKSTLSKYIEWVNRKAESGVESYLVSDDENGHYMWVDWGWRERRRVKNINVYARIINDRIWIQEDWTEEGIANELVRAGVPPEDIVLGFQPPEMRKYTDFAAA